MRGIEPPFLAWEDVNIIPIYAGFRYQYPRRYPRHEKQGKNKLPEAKTSGIILAVIINPFKSTNVFCDQLRLGESLPGKFQDPGNEKVFLKNSKKTC
jgi:hypothetical protein